MLMAQTSQYTVNFDAGRVASRRFPPLICCQMLCPDVLRRAGANQHRVTRQNHNALTILFLACGLDAPLRVLTKPRPAAIGSARDLATRSTGRVAAKPVSRRKAAPTRRWRETRHNTIRPLRSGKQRTDMAKALLFDLDGTLIMSDHLHYEVFAEFFAERGRTLTQAIYDKSIHGTHNLDSFPKLFPGEDPQALSEEKEARFRSRLNHGTPPLAGAVALLDLAESRGWKTAIVTNAPRPNALHMLDAIGLTPRFDTIVLGEECVRAKPDPAPYLEAMRLLGVTPTDCIAFEDSESGMRAAQRSGAYTVGLLTGISAERLCSAGARTTITDYMDPALDAVLARL